MKSQKIVLICVFYLSGCYLFGNTLLADSQDKQIQNYLKNAKLIQAEKRKARIASQKVSGRKIKYYLKKKSVAQSKKGKAKTAAVKMVDVGLITASMVKKNRWFVKKPFQTSYTKIKSIELYRPPEVSPEENNRISRKVNSMSKTRARNTGAVKPDSLYSGSTSRNAKQMTKTRSFVTGPAKTGVVYTESASRAVLDITKTRARLTGPIKPDSLYSEVVSRDALKISNERSKNKFVYRKGIVYSVELLKSMSRRPPIKNMSLNTETANAKK